MGGKSYCENTVSEFELIYERETSLQPSYSSRTTDEDIPVELHEQAEQAYCHHAEETYQLYERHETILVKYLSFKYLDSIPTSLHSQYESESPSHDMRIFHEEFDCIETHLSCPPCPLDQALSLNLTEHIQCNEVFEIATFVYDNFQEFIAHLTSDCDIENHKTELKVDYQNIKHSMKLVEQTSCNSVIFLTSILLSDSLSLLLFFHFLFGFYFKPARVIHKAQLCIASSQVCYTRLFTTATLLLIMPHSCNATTLILEGPNSTNATFYQEIAVFDCIGTGPPDTDLFFSVNKTPADFTLIQQMGFIQSPVANDGNILSRTLTVYLRVSPDTVSNTEIVCEVINTVDILNIMLNTSDSAFLFVQGELDPVTNILVTFMNATTVNISWTAPPTLTGTIINGYNVSNINSGDRFFTEEDQTTYYFDSPDPCVSEQIQIRSFNGIDGKPANSSDIYPPSKPPRNKKISIRSISVRNPPSAEFFMNVSGLCRGEYPNRVIIREINATTDPWIIDIDLSNVTTRDTEIFIAKIPLNESKTNMFNFTFSNVLGNFAIFSESFVDIPLDGYNGGDPTTSTTFISVSPSPPMFVSPTVHPNDGNNNIPVYIYIIIAVVMIIVVAVMVVICAYIKFKKRHKQQSSSKTAGDIKSIPPNTSLQAQREEQDIKSQEDRLYETAGMNIGDPPEEQDYVKSQDNRRSGGSVGSTAPLIEEHCHL